MSNKMEHRTSVRWDADAFKWIRKAASLTKLSESDVVRWAVWEVRNRGLMPFGPTVAPTPDAARKAGGA